MKKSLLRAALFLAAGATLTLLCGSAALATAPRFGPALFQQDQGLKIYAYDLPPLLDGRMPGMGLAANLVQTALEEEGIAVQIEVLPVRSLARRTVLYDGALAVLGEPGLFTRSEGGRLSGVPYHEITCGYYYYRPGHKEGVHLTGELKSLRRYRVGVLPGEELARYRSAGVKVVSEELSSLVRRLKGGELDVLALPDQVAKEYLQRRLPREVADFVRVPAPSWQLPLTVFFNEQHPRAKRVKAALLRGLQAIRKNGKYQKMVAIYQGGGEGSETYLPSASLGTVEFGSNDSPPFYAPDLPHDGMAGEVVHAILEELHLKGRIHYFPLKRLRTDLKNNHLGDPENFVGQHFSAIVPVALYRCAFFYYLPRHRNGIPYRTPGDLNGYRVGIVRGTLEDRGYFDRHAITVVEANNEEALFRLLKEGRIDLCGVIRESGRYTVGRYFPGEGHDFVPVEIPDSVGPITIMLDGTFPDGASLGDRMDEALTRIIKNGTYQHILEKYYGKGQLPADFLTELEQYRTRYRRGRFAAALQ